jgi:GNAT superfamily N-acetyltransferase
VGPVIAGELRIEAASERDVPLILSFIHKIAEYEKLSHLVTAKEDTLRLSLFGPNPAAEVLLAYWQDAPAGYAVFFTNFSTFLGQAGIYLEDIFVEPALRGKGIGKALLAVVAKEAQGRGCSRLEWAVLDWNKPSIDFYVSLGAKPLDEWTIFRMTGEAIGRLAEFAPTLAVQKAGEHVKAKP